MLSMQHLSTMMNIIEARQVSKTYLVDNRQIRILDDISLSIAEGEFIAITGNSGSGKTTLLSLLSGLDKPNAGRVLINQIDVTDLSEDELAPLRNETIGFVFQSFHLVPSLNALENVSFPAELRNDKEAVKKAIALVERVGLCDRRTNFPQQLSGGEKQRIAICRALINNPKIIFADEPTGNLDSANSDAILSLLHELHIERGTTLILATHSNDIAALADRVVSLNDGCIAEEQKGAA
jgi:putative ABC transport system ATP-binding protein